MCTVSSPTVQVPFLMSKVISAAEHARLTLGVPGSAISSVASAAFTLMVMSQGAFAPSHSGTCRAASSSRAGARQRRSSAPPRLSSSGRDMVPRQGLPVLAVRSQAVISTRAPGRTPVPERESIRSLAAHQATMVLFLSTSLTELLQDELLAGGYTADTPAAVVYKATWPEEHIFRCTVGTLHETVTGNSLTKTSLIVVGNCLGDTYLRSLLYHPNFTTEFRKGAQ